MKRIALLICVILSGTLFGYAQVRSTDANDTLRPLSSTLRQNWFVSAGGNIDWWQGSDRNPAGNYTQVNGPFFGTEFAVGKWITHKTAVRFTYHVNRAHSFVNGKHEENCPNFQFLFKENPTADENGYYPTTFMYHNFYGDVMLSPVDLFVGYYENRFYLPVVTLGMGVACVSEHYFVTQTFIEDGFGKNRNFEPSANVGLINNFSMNPSFAFTLAANLTATRFSVDSWTTGEYGTSGNITPRPRFVDFNYSLAMGITWNLSGNEETGNRYYELPFNYSKEMKEMQERIKNLEDELDKCSKNRPTDTIFVNSTDTIYEFTTYPFSVFFHLDDDQLMSGRDVINLEAIAQAAISRGLTIHLRGSCDSATGSATYNEGLALRRCNTVYKILVSKGVDKNQIYIQGVGGVHELDPTKYDRRVLITLGKKNDNNNK